MLLRITPCLTRDRDNDSWEFTVDGVYPWPRIYPVVCHSALRRYFHIPQNARTLYLVVCDDPSPHRIEVSDVYSHRDIAKYVSFFPKEDPQAPDYSFESGPRVRYAVITDYAYELLQKARSCQLCTVYVGVFADGEPCPLREV